MAILAIFSGNIHAIDISAESAVLYDPLSEEIIFQKNENHPMGMASTTKIMTAIIALENYDVQQTITIDKAWCGAEGSSIYLKPGEKLKIIELLYGLLLHSGNDAAQALASIKTRDNADFVKLMNDKAKLLGMKNTRFENPSGLDSDNHYSTAFDMALLASYAMENAVFREITGTKSIKIGQRYFKNHNKLLWNLDGAVGGKTGFTKKCGRCLVSVTEKNGRMLVAVTLRAPNDWNDHSAMYSYGFAEFSMRTVVKAGSFANVPLVSGLKPLAKICTEKDISVFVRATDKITTKITACPMVYAPIKQGELYGDLYIQVNGKTVNRQELFFEESIERLPYKKGFFEKIADKFKEMFKV